MTPDEAEAMTGPDPATGVGSQGPLTRAVWLRLLTAMVALAAGVAALVIAVDLIRSTLS